MFCQIILGHHVFIIARILFSSSRPKRSRSRADSLGCNIMISYRYTRRIRVRQPMHVPRGLFLIDPTETIMTCDGLRYVQHDRSIQAKNGDAHTRRIIQILRTSDWRGAPVTSICVSALEFDTRVFSKACDVDGLQPLVACASNRHKLYAPESRIITIIETRNTRARAGE